MTEAKDDIALIVERQLGDVKEAQTQYLAIAEGREVHPAVLQQQVVATNVTTLEVIPNQENAVPPGTPAAPMGTVPIAIKISLAVVVLLVCLLIKQRLQQESD